MEGSGLPLDRSVGARRLTVGLTFGVMAISVLDLLGWVLHVPLLTSVLPHYATMKPNTAVCLALLAGAIGVREGAARVWRMAAFAAGVVALGVSGLSLLEYGVHRGFGIDQLLLATPGGGLTDAPGRMSMATAFCLVLCGLAATLRDRLPRVSTGLSIVGLTIAASGLVGFVSGAGPLVAVPAMRSLAVHTGTALFLLFWAALASRPDREPYATLSAARRREGRRRSMLLAVTLIPFALGLPVMLGLHLRLYDGAFALALLLSVLLVAQTGVFWLDGLELNKVENRLRASEMRARLILQSIGDGVIVTDAAGRVTEMNALAEFLTGWAVTEAKGVEFDEVFQIVLEKTGEKLESPIAKAMTTREVVALANGVMLLRRGGGTTHIEDSCAPILEPDGRLTGSVLVFRNVDERKALEAERRLAAAALIQSEKLAAVGRLSSSIAHEINNPVESVTNLLYLMQGEQDPEAIRRYAGIAEKELLRVTAIAQQTLNFNRHSTEAVPVRMQELIDGVLAVYHAKMLNSGAVVEQRVREGTMVACFEGEIRQVIGNLIGNALDAMAPAARGRLLLRVRGGHRGKDGAAGVFVTIADTGSGIKAETIRHIFEPFYTTKGMAGTGLGLWISHEIVERHGASLRVRSKSEGERRGTVFVMFLPGVGVGR